MPEDLRAGPGVTLVELLLFIAILSLVSLGIMQMVLDVQKTNIEFLGLADQLAESDLALRRVQVKLGDSDDVEVIELQPSSGDQACLRLKSYEEYSRSGFRFDGRNQYLRTSSAAQNFVEIDATDPRTVSVWVRVDPDQAGTGSVVMWGNGSKREFGVAIEDGMPVMHLKCARLRPRMPVDLRDGAWHHIALTLAGQAGAGITTSTAKIYVDGVSLATEFDECSAFPGSLFYTTRTPLYIGRTRGDRQSGFKGLVSDVRTWQRGLTSSEIKALAGREPSADANIAGLYARLPLDGLPGGQIENKGPWSAGGTATRFNISTPDQVVKTLVDATTYNSFCFLDADGDRLYELWESETSKTVPALPLGTPSQLNGQGWQNRSEDIFVPGPHGFFKVIGRDPESVVANFAVGKGVHKNKDQTEKVKSKALASTRVNRRLELCAVEVEPRLASDTCQLDRAFVGIDGYIQGLHGRLDLQHVTWTTVGNTRVASNIANMPSGVTATWYPAVGVLKFHSPQALETRLWNRVIGQVLYRPTGRSADATITFRMGLGGLPFFEVGKYRMYDFQAASASPLAFDNATTLATSSGGAFCGMRSYLASITSEAEQEHLEDVMMTADTAGWQSGWIGATVNANQTFEWVSKPQAGLPFWVGAGVTGRPYDIATGQPAPVNSASVFEYDQDPSRTGHRKRRLMQNDDPAAVYRYGNWAGGNDTTSCDTRSGVPAVQQAPVCEPLQVGDGTGVAIHGHMNGEGTWFGSPGATPVCDATRQHSICGYYREFDDIGLPASMSLARSITVNMDRFREFCLAP